MLRVTAWPSVMLSGAKNLSGDAGEMARLALSSAKPPALSKARECVATSAESEEPRRPSLGKKASAGGVTHRQTLFPAKGRGPDVMTENDFV
jgi:hypothetical protein